LDLLEELQGEMDDLGTWCGMMAWCGMMWHDMAEVWDGRSWMYSCNKYMVYYGI
jgi:hypothetical protein